MIFTLRHPNHHKPTTHLGLRLIFFDSASYISKWGEVQTPGRPQLLAIVPFYKTLVWSTCGLSVYSALILSFRENNMVGRRSTCCLYWSVDVTQTIYSVNKYCQASWTKHPSCNINKTTHSWQPMKNYALDNQKDNQKHLNQDLLCAFASQCL